MHTETEDQKHARHFRVMLYLGGGLTALGCGIAQVATMAVSGASVGAMIGVGLAATVVGGVLGTVGTVVGITVLAGIVVGGEKIWRDLKMTFGKAPEPEAAPAARARAPATMEGLKEAYQSAASQPVSKVTEIKVIAPTPTQRSAPVI